MAKKKTALKASTTAGDPRRCLQKNRLTVRSRRGAGNSARRSESIEEFDDDSDGMRDGEVLESRALELSRWPRVAKQILKDVLTERLDGLLRPRGSQGAPPLSSTRRGRVSLRDMLNEVLRETQERVRGGQGVSRGLSGSDAGGEDLEISSEQLEGVCSTKRLSVSSLPYLLQLLFADGVLRLQAQEDQHLGKELGSMLRLPVSVYATSLQSQWAARAATEFLHRIQEIGLKVWASGSSSPGGDPTFLNIGIVGGSTVRMIVQQLKESADWDLDFGVKTSLWGSVRILALNVCLTRAEELPSNANVLVNELREAMERQVGRGKQGARIHGVGLLATLIKPSDPEKYDRDLRELLEITDPALLQASNCREDVRSSLETQLHIVLTSIGAAKGTIFDRLGTAESNDHKRTRMVGDLLYTCFDAEGEIVELTNQSGEPYSLFSAVSLGTLERMVGSQDRCVMLVARKNPGGERKHVAIHSALQNHRYASCLILDRDTARDLYNRHQAMQ